MTLARPLVMASAMILSAGAAAAQTAGYPRLEAVKAYVAANTVERIAADLFGGPAPATFVRAEAIAYLPSPWGQVRLWGPVGGERLAKPVGDIGAVCSVTSARAMMKSTSPPSFSERTSATLFKAVRVGQINASGDVAGFCGRIDPAYFDTAPDAQVEAEAISRLHAIMARPDDFDIHKGACLIDAEKPLCGLTEADLERGLTVEAGDCAVLTEGALRSTGALFAHSRCYEVRSFTPLSFTMLMEADGNRPKVAFVRVLMVS